VLCLSVLSCSKPSSNNHQETIAPSVYQLSTVQYKSATGVNADLLSLDIYHYNTPNEKRPVVIYIHGGGWQGGDKNNKLDNKLNLFNSLNYVFISINYRLSPNPADLSDANRIMFPTHSEDVADAIKWILTNIHIYGGDSNKLVILGHSAGAHLAALTGVSKDFLPVRGIQLIKIKGVACVDGKYDIVTQGLEASTMHLNAFGNSPLIWTQASPTFSIMQGAQLPKYFLALRGTQQRMDRANSFISELKRDGVNVTSILCQEYDHEGINNAIGLAGETCITIPLKNFITSCFQ
jgi:pimeloyl-ACP methyl ester carboxylesterase